MENQTTIFDMLYPKKKITKPIRMITLFSGYDSQCLAMNYLGVKYEHWKTCEWAVKSIQALKDIHFADDNVDYSVCMTKESLINNLYNLGISSNYNEPMTLEQIKRLNEKQLRTIYNNIVATNNLVNIQQVKGEDLEIKDTEKYEYIMTYSFPCQDISGAGKGAGFTDKSTRSGMLWEVERILQECKDLGTLPQILLMENVPLIHSVDNLEDFNKWKLRLEELGYKNYFQDLIATDYGIPQTRNRCFMVSLLGDYNYTFPKPIPLKLKLKDLLEENVDEKYYLSDKMINYVLNRTPIGEKDNYANNIIGNDATKSAGTITTKGSNSGTSCRSCDNFIVDNMTQNEIDKNIYLKIKNATKQGYLEATEGDGIDISSRMEYHRGTVQKGKTQTLTTMGGENNGVVVLKKELCNKLIQDGKIKENDVIRHNYTTSKNGNCIQSNNEAPTLDTRCDCVGVCVKGIATNESKEWQKPPLEEMSRTLLANKSNAGVGLIDTNLRIRKLTPRECFRLMGVKDEDFDKVAKNQSDSSLYHLAGDSIVCDVLCHIFKELL